MAASSSKQFKNICVFSGFHYGKYKEFVQTTVDLGRFIVERKLHLVYGEGERELSRLVSEDVEEAKVALLHASKELNRLETENPNQKIGVHLVQNALKMPVYTIASVAGFYGSVVVEKLLEQDDPNLGFNPATGASVNMIESRNVDPMEQISKELEFVAR
ncbi:hypothetical protein WN944_018505 [Citrus x changshan-huyou]|uniref:Uncharacterized protein n=1 Tax=Citrus x changshan-huyou TaxID=2935761 RepID=A0AAP0QFI0_9ROSI